MTEPPLVLLTGGRPVVLHGLAGVLGTEGFACCVAEGTSRPDRRPAVVVVDVAGQDPARAGQLVELAAATYADVPVLAVMDPTDLAADGPGRARLVHRLPATASPADVGAEVRRLAGGRGPGDPAPAMAPDPLSPREREVVELVLAGHDDRSVAAALGVGAGTVRTHLRRAAAKLHLDGPLRSRGNGARDGAGDAGYRPPAARPFEVAIAVEAHEALAGAAVAHLLAQRPPCRVLEPGDEERPDLVVVVGVPADVVDATARHPGVPVLHVASAADPGDPFESIRVGADGYVGAYERVADLVAAAERVAIGGVHLTPAGLRSLCQRLRTGTREDDDAVRRLVDLTRTERSVLGLVVDGLTIAEIAETLVVSPLTARTHVQGVLRKLGAHSQAEAAAYARRHRLVERSTSVARQG